MVKLPTDVSVNRLSIPITVGVAVMVGVLTMYGAYGAFEDKQDIHIQLLELESAVHKSEAEASRANTQVNLEEISTMLKNLTAVQVAHDRRILVLEMGTGNN